LISTGWRVSPRSGEEAYGRVLMWLRIVDASIGTHDAIPPQTSGV
jgi:hypothetical protein